MTSLAFQMSFPLEWPVGRPKTVRRKPALFRQEGRSLTFTRGRSRLLEQLAAMTRVGQRQRTTGIVLSCNIRFTIAGHRDRTYSQREPDDPGAALYFCLDDQPHVLACDRWDTVADNVAAIAAHIEALRGQERWGVADLRQAFAGHVALPAPDPWWRVLDVTRDAPIEAITRAYRAAARTAHPDAGGQRAEWDRLNAAYESAKKERTR